ncbi:MAG: MFS transporter [Firmicutes bacterium]|nr:MFS transporter [Bacillota bacterium]
MKRNERTKGFHRPPAPEAAGGHTSVQRNVIFVAVLTAFITTFMGSALNLSIPAIEEEFQVGAATVGWTITIYMLTCAALAVPFGRLADLLDRRFILSGGILIFMVASLGAALVRGIGILLFIRFLQGVGASMIFSTNLAVLVGAFDEKERGKVLGYATSANYVGMSAGPVLGGLLNGYLGWRALFYVAAAVCGAAFYSAVKKLPPKEQKQGFYHSVGFDIAGCLLYVFGIVFITYGLSIITEKFYGWLMVAGGLTLMVCLFYTERGKERRVETPVIKISLFHHNGAYVCSNLAAMMNYGANFAISYLLSVYLQTVAGYSSEKAGMVLIIAPVVQAVLSIFIGRISDKGSPHLLSALGMGLCGGALFFYARLTENTSMAMIFSALAVSGIGFALFASPNANAVMGSVKSGDYGVATSILSTMRSLGHTFSMTIVTMVVRYHMGNGSLKEAGKETLLKTMEMSFFIFGVICIIGIFMALKRKVW